MFFPLLLLACTPSPKDTATPDDTGGGRADMPAYCEEESREVLDNPYSVPDGMWFAAGEAIEAQSGTFSGPLVPYEGGVGSNLTLVNSLAEGEVALVTRVLVDPSAGDTGHATGAPEPTECPPVYVYGLDVALSSDDGQWGGSFRAEMEVADPAVGELSTSQSIEALTGSAAPSWDPADWDNNSLVLSASLVPDGWQGSLSWSAGNETMASGEAETGEVDVSGMTEGVGSFELVKAETAR